MAVKPKSVANIVCEPMVNVESQSFSDVSALLLLYSREVAISPDSTVRSISILRDTGAAQSFILEGALPFSNETYTGTDVLVRGIELSCIRVPLHTVFLTS